MSNKSTTIEAQQLALYTLDIFSKAYEKYPTDGPKRISSVVKNFDKFKEKLDAIIANHI